jgi:hypothetical protein
MPATNTPVASNAVASTTVASTTVALTPLIATPVQSTTATANPQPELKRKRGVNLSASNSTQGGSRSKIVIDLEFKEQSTSVVEVNKINDFLEREDIQDTDIMDEVKRRVAIDGFPQEIINFFAKKNSIDPELVSIDKFNGQGINAFGHFIITHEEKKWHAKPAINGPRTSLGSKYNELAFYKINELSKIGPECDGFVSKDGVLMILTEDLSLRSLGEANEREAKGEKFIKKEIAFTDNVGLKDQCDNIPERHRENVHRCATEIYITLLSLADVQKNLGNTGFKKTIRKLEDLTEEEKFKPFIVDFRLLNREDAASENGPFSSLPADGPFSLYKHKIKKIEEYVIELQNILNEKSSDKEFPKNIFAFKKDPLVVKDALTKLFLDENGDINKFNKNIEAGFAFAIEKLKESCDISDENFVKHLTILDKQKTEKLEMLNIFLENDVIRTFLEEAGKKIKEEKFSKQETESNPRTDVSPTNSSVKSIGSQGTDSPLPLYLFLAAIF